MTSSSYPAVSRKPPACPMSRRAWPTTSATRTGNAVQDRYSGPDDRADTAFGHGGLHPGRTIQIQGFSGPTQPPHGSLKVAPPNPLKDRTLGALSCRGQPKAGTFGYLPTGGPGLTAGSRDTITDDKACCDMLRPHHPQNSHPAPKVSALQETLLFRHLTARFTARLCLQPCTPLLIYPQKPNMSGP